MKKLLALIVCIGFNMLPSKAQNIPDSSFALLIRTYCPECIDEKNNLLPPAKNLTQLNGMAYGVTGIAGIEGLTSLRVLKLSGNHITEIPPLPASINELDFSDNEVTNLSQLPPFITNLDLSHNHITTLPPLPKSLTDLNVSYNNLTVMPALPPALLNLWCLHNPSLSALPQLPSSLQQLSMGETNIASIKSLPSGLTRLNCEETSVSKLPELPESLLYLNVDGTPMTSLPNIPSGMKVLTINDHNITCIPGNNYDLIVMDQNDIKISPVFCNGVGAPSQKTTELSRMFFFNANEVGYHNEQAYSFANTITEAKSTFSYGAAIVAGIEKIGGFGYNIFVFEVTYISSITGYEETSKTYEVHVKPEQRTVSQKILFRPSQLGLYTIRAYKLLIASKNLIAEGTISVVR